jgi:dihydrodipicolinate synthase/N-acetylneuraminate lyase
MIPKLLPGVAGIAIALGASGWATASAAIDPNPFSHLSCACQDSDPPGSPALRDNINQGLHQGISAPPVVE